MDAVVQDVNALVHHTLQDFLGDERVGWVGSSDVLAQVAGFDGLFLRFSHSPAQNKEAPMYLEKFFQLLRPSLHPHLLYQFRRTHNSKFWLVPPS